ncbi:MAG: hypothetical protein GKS01_02080 [Alphaproteobacteria bacterium]|nr:hypothetical protein [Alphaproteobacteria bacterium]
MKSLRSLALTLFMGIAAISISSNANAGPVIAAFDFENATAGSATAAASTTGAGISGALFGGTNGSSSVVAFSDNTYTSGALFPGANGSLFNFFTFTTATSLDLGALTFESGQNDIPNVSRTFEVRLSPAGTPTPTGVFGTDTAGWSLLDSITVPFGFADSGTPNVALDLTGTSIGPGTYTIGIGAQAGIGKHRHDPTFYG